MTSDDGRFVVIRPLAYAAESDLAAFAEKRQFPILPCLLCGSQENAQRKQMKALLAEMEQKHPTLRQTMLAAMGNVNLSHLYDRSATQTADEASESIVPVRWFADDPVPLAPRSGRGRRLVRPSTRERGRSGRSELL